MRMASDKIQHLIDHSSIDIAGTEIVPARCVKLLGGHIDEFSLVVAQIFETVSFGVFLPTPNRS